MATGFAPRLVFLVLECKVEASYHDGDCDLGAGQYVTVDGSGTMRIDYTALEGFSQVNCSSPGSCEIDLIRTDGNNFDQDVTVTLNFS